MSWLKRLRAAFAGDTDTDADYNDREYAAARDRWLRSNAERKAAGCRCGQPATYVRRFGGTVGGVPAEYWYCADHTNVNSWTSSDGGRTYTPGPDITPEQLDALRPWIVSEGPA